MATQLQSTVAFAANGSSCMTAVYAAEAAVAAVGEEEELANGNDCDHAAVRSPMPGSPMRGSPLRDVGPWTPVPAVALPERVLDVSNSSDREGISTLQEMHSGAFDAGSHIDAEGAGFPSSPASAAVAAAARQNGVCHSGSGHRGAGSLLGVGSPALRGGSPMRLPCGAAGESDADDSFADPLSPTKVSSAGDFARLVERTRLKLARRARYRQELAELSSMAETRKARIVDLFSDLEREDSRILRLHANLRAKIEESTVEQAQLRRVAEQQDKEKERLEEGVSEMDKHLSSVEFQVQTLMDHLVTLLSRGVTADCDAVIQDILRGSEARHEAAERRVALFAGFLDEVRQENRVHAQRLTDMLCTTTDIHERINSRQGEIMKSKLRESRFRAERSLPATAPTPQRQHRNRASSTSQRMTAGDRGNSCSSGSGSSTPTAAPASSGNALSALKAASPPLPFPVYAVIGVSPRRGSSSSNPPQRRPSGSSAAGGSGSGGGAAAVPAATPAGVPVAGGSASGLGGGAGSLGSVSGASDMVPGSSAGSLVAGLGSCGSGVAVAAAAIANGSVNSCSAASSSAPARRGVATPPLGPASPQRGSTGSSPNGSGSPPLSIVGLSSPRRSSSAATAELLRSNGSSPRASGAGVSVAHGGASLRGTASPPSPSSGVGRHCSAGSAAGAGSSTSSTNGAPGHGGAATSRHSINGAANGVNPSAPLIMDLTALESRLHEALSAMNFTHTVVRLGGGIYRFGADVQAFVNLAPDGQLMAWSGGRPSEPIRTFLARFDEGSTRAGSSCYAGSSSSSAQAIGEAASGSATPGGGGGSSVTAVAGSAGELPREPAWQPASRPISPAPVPIPSSSCHSQRCSAGVSPPPGRGSGGNCGGRNQASAQTRLRPVPTTRSASASTTPAAQARSGSRGGGGGGGGGGSTAGGGGACAQARSQVRALSAPAPAACRGGVPATSSAACATASAPMSASPAAPFGSGCCASVLGGGSLPAHAPPPASRGNSPPHSARREPLPTMARGAVPCAGAGSGRGSTVSSPVPSRTPSNPPPGHHSGSAALPSSGTASQRQSPPRSPQMQPARAGTPIAAVSAVPSGATPAVGRWSWPQQPHLGVGAVPAAASRGRTPPPGAQTWPQGCHAGGGPASLGSSTTTSTGATRRCGSGGSPAAGGSSGATVMAAASGAAVAVASAGGACAISRAGSASPNTVTATPRRLR